MCNASSVIFGAVNLSEKEILAKRVLEIGSCDVNGSLRKLLERWKPAEYIGIDIEQGPGVDQVCSVDQAVERFGARRFDAVVSTEMIEHVADWRKAVSNIKNLCAPGGIILLTTRSAGFAYHAYPHDFWRFEVEDMRAIFSDCVIEKIEADAQEPGVFIKAVKPADFSEKDLSGYELYSIIERRRVKEIDEEKLAAFRKSYDFSQKLSNALSRLKNAVFSRFLRS